MEKGSAASQPKLGLNSASKTDGGHFGNRDFSVERICSGYAHDSDSGNWEITESWNWSMKEGKRRERSGITSKGFCIYLNKYLSICTKTELGIVEMDKR